MKDDSSFLDIFQDPLLTIIALVLLITVCMIVPSTLDSHTGKDFYRVQEEIEELKKEIASTQARLKSLELEMKRLADELQWLEGLDQEAKREKEIQAREIDKLGQKVTRLKELIKNENRELESLKKELEKAGNRKSMEEIVREIERINENMESRKALLETLEEKLSRLKEKQTQRKKERKEKGKRKDDIRDLINAVKNEIESKEKELKKIEKLAKGGGYGEYSEEKTKGKEQVIFEAVNNRIVPVNDKNYNAEVYRSVCGGRVVRETKLTKNSYIQGNSITEIDSPESEFQRELNKYNSNEQYIFFLTHGNSFEVFRKARGHAFEKGFVVAWYPYNRDSIYMSPCGEQVEGR